MYKFKKKRKPVEGKKAPSTPEEKAYHNKVLSKNGWIVTLVIALIAGFILVKAYISIILLATLMAVLFNGVYKGLLAKFNGSRPKAALLVTIYSVLAFGIPLMIILFLAFNQVQGFIESLALGELSVGELDLEEASTEIVDGINQVASDTIGVNPLVNVTQVTDFMKNVLPEVLNVAVDLVVGITKSIPALFMNSIIYFFVFTGLLVNQENIAKRLKYLSPLPKDLNDKLVARTMAMSKAMLKGQLLIAFTQALAGATSLAIVGFSEYFVFFVLLFTLMNLIPLGSGIILIPLGIIMIPFGFVWQGLFILGVHFIVTTNIDNYIRPKVVPKDAWLPASLTIISALGGVALFGLVGVVYGPIIAIAVMTVLESYTDMKQKEALKTAKA